MKNISTYDRVKVKITEVQDLYGKTAFTKWFPQALCIADFKTNDGTDNVRGVTEHGDKVELHFHVTRSEMSGMNAIVRLRLNGHVVDHFGAVSGGQFETEDDVNDFKSMLSLWGVVKHVAYEAEHEDQKKAKDLWEFYRNKHALRG